MVAWWVTDVHSQAVYAFKRTDVSVFHRCLFFFGTCLVLSRTFHRSASPLAVSPAYTVCVPSRPDPDGRRTRLPCTAKRRSTTQRLATCNSIAVVTLAMMLARLPAACFHYALRPTRHRAFHDFTFLPSTLIRCSAACWASRGKLVASFSSLK